MDKDISYIDNTICKEISAIEGLRKSLDPTVFSKVLDIMQNTPGRIIMTGMGKSGIIARKIVASLASTGTPAIFLHPAEASHGDLGMVTPQDTVVAISNSGESKELADIINYCKRFDINLIGITKNPLSTLGKNVNYVLALPQMPEADPLGLAPTSSTTVTLVLGDILTVALMDRKKFTAKDFGLRHPGGKLGSILQTVKEIMHTDRNMPILSENAPFEQIIVEMSDKRLGCVGFTDAKGNLCGIFTDGDLRRSMSPDLFHKTGKDLMNLHPQQISSDLLCSAALRLMNEKKITSLFVTQNNKPIGIVHIHDLLSTKVS